MNREGRERDQRSDGMLSYKENLGRADRDFDGEMECRSYKQGLADVEAWVVGNQLRPLRARAQACLTKVLHTFPKTEVPLGSFLV